MYAKIEKKAVVVKEMFPCDMRAGTSAPVTNSSFLNPNYPSPTPGCQYDSRCPHPASHPLMLKRPKLDPRPETRDPKPGRHASRQDCLDRGPSRTGHALCDQGGHGLRERRHHSLRRFSPAPFLPRPSSRVSFCACLSIQRAHVYPTRIQRVSNVLPVQRVRLSNLRMGPEKGGE
jgi:hypothetical protein